MWLFVKFCQFFRKYVNIPVLGKSETSEGNKGAICGCNLGNSVLDSSFWILRKSGWWYSLTLWVPSCLWFVWWERFGQEQQMCLSLYPPWLGKSSPSKEQLLFTVFESELPLFHSSNQLLWLFLPSYWFIHKFIISRTK